MERKSKRQQVQKPHPIQQYIPVQQSYRLRPLHHHDIYLYKWFVINIWWFNNAAGASGVSGMGDESTLDMSTDGMGMRMHHEGSGDEGIIYTLYSISIH